MLRKRVAALREIELVPGKIPADREQHGNAAADTFGGVSKALRIKIETLLTTTNPTSDQASTLREKA